MFVNNAGSETRVVQIEFFTSHFLLSALSNLQILP
jgi:hypothetical protein